MFEEFNITDKARVLEILNENFPGHFIVESSLDTDLFLMPVKDCSREHEWLGLDSSRKQFKYFVSRESNYMSVQFNDDLPGDKIRIYDFTDIHVGSKAFRESLLKEHINNVLNDPMAFFVIGGDLIEAITKMSVGDPDEQYCSINAQSVEAVKLFLPIAHKCLGYEAGNHDRGRTHKSSQFDVARTMADMLRIPYFQVRVTIDLHFRGKLKTISLAHKYGNATSQPAIINQVRKILAQLTTPVHCWFSGHNHTSFVQPLETVVKIPGKGFESMRYYVSNGGSFVNYTSTYAEEAGYGRSPQDLVYFEFDDRGNYTSNSVPIMSV
jgi:hypothetical protein